jgi:hypothetical protein
MRPLLTIMLIVLSATVALGATEAEHCRRLAPKYHAQLEVRMWDGTRVDLTNAEYAFEVDFAHKWAEGVGQALYYSQLTGKKAGLILLTEKGEARFAYRAQTAAARAGVVVFIEWIEEKSSPKDNAIDINIGPLNIHVPRFAQAPADDVNVVRVYMVQNEDGRWLRRTIPGQINTWIVDQGSASVWANKQEVHRAWASIGFLRERAKVKTFLLVPLEED